MIVRIKHKDGVVQTRRMDVKRYLVRDDTDNIEVVRYFD